MSGDLCGQDGLAQATRFIAWVGKNMPGFDYAKKAAVLVSKGKHYLRDVCHPCS
jgi:hypothetical protein